MQKGHALAVSSCCKASRSREPSAQAIKRGGRVGIWLCRQSDRLADPYVVPVDQTGFLSSIAGMPIYEKENRHRFHNKPDPRHYGLLWRAEVGPAAAPPLSTVINSRRFKRRRLNFAAPQLVPDCRISNWQYSVRRRRTADFRFGSM
jgi:hypothetical protein